MTCDYFKEITPHLRKLFPPNYMPLLVLVPIRLEKRRPVHLVSCLPSPSQGPFRLNRTQNWGVILLPSQTICLCLRKSKSSGFLFFPHQNNTISCQILLIGKPLTKTVEAASPVKNDFACYRNSTILGALN